MRERKFVKLRIDMYEDTKFKIIDTMDGRDLIHYIWSRIIILAGKVNLEGDLYLSRNIPYTIETFAIEFNRNAIQVKLALNTLIDLEMVELVQGKIYRVKNFAKHQNIKRKEKVEIKNNEIEMKDNEVEIQYTAEEIKNKEEKSLENQLFEEKMHGNCKENTQINNNIKGDNFKNDLRANIPILMRNKKSPKANKDNKNNISSIDVFEKEDIMGFFDGEYNMPLGKGDKVIMSFRV